MLNRAIVLALTFTVLPCSVRASEVNLRMLGDFVLAGDEDLTAQNKMRTRDSYIDFVHGRLFFDAGTGRTSFFVQLVLSDVASTPVRIHGAYLQHQLFEGRQHYLQAGKIPVPEGTWAPRTYADRNPLVGLPFAYYWQSGLPVSSVPASLDDLVARADDRTSYGAMMLYDNCWNEGVNLLGASGAFSYALAATRGAPGNPVFGGPENQEIAVHAKLGYSPVPEIQTAISWGRGAYLTDSASADLAPGQSVNDYLQNIFVGSLTLARGYLEFHGEFFWNHFETPLRDDGLHSWSVYGDLEWKFAAGWYAAARYDTMRFEDVEATGGAQSWDTDLQRVEAGVGYHFSRDLLLKGIVQANDVGGGFTGETLLPMVQAVLRF